MLQAKYQQIVLRAKFPPPLVFVNKVLLELSIPIRWYIDYGCFPAAMAELNSCDKDHVTHRKTAASLSKETW